MPSILDYLSPKGQGPSYSKYASSIMGLPPDQQTNKNALDIAIQAGFPRPAEAADAVMKSIDADRKRLKENQPTGTVPLDLPLAQTLNDITTGKLNYLQPTPMSAPLGYKDNLPMTLQDLAPLLPPNAMNVNNLPSPIQKQQPELSLFGPSALAALPQQISQKYIPSEVLTKYLGTPKLPDYGDTLESISKELYNMPYANLNQAQSAKVNEEVKNRNLAQSVEKEKQLLAIRSPDFGNQREAMAKELFNKNFATLNPAEINQVDTEIRKRENEQKVTLEKTLQPLRVEVAAQTGVAAAVGKEKSLRELPLTPEERSKYMNPDTLAIPPPEMTKAEAIKEGYVAVQSTQDKDILYDLPNVKVQIDTIDKLVNGLITAPDAWSAITQGVRLKLGGWSKINPDAATYEDIRAAYLGVLSRRLGGERGVLTDRDIDRIKGSLPSFRDTAVIKNYKMNIVKNIINMAVENQKRKLIGQPPMFDSTKVQDMFNKLTTKKTPVRIGVDSTTGKQVYQFDDGSIEYAP